MRRRTRLVSLSLVIVLLLSTLPRHTWAQEDVRTGPDLSRVEHIETDCSWLDAGGSDVVVQLGPISCGTLAVPENWRRPGEQQVDLSYVILRQTGDEPAADPVVYLAGGPGGSTLDGVPFFAELFAGFREHRDVVLYDQRGTGRSSPLQCSDWTIDDLFNLPLSDGPAEEPDSADAGQSPGAPGISPTGPTPSLTASALLEQARVDAGDAMARCATEMLAAGIDLRQYNSIASASDLVALMRSLGYDTYNLYGISYGTRLALVTMREYPRSGIRGVVLDSTYPPGMRGFEVYPAEPHEVVIQLFADCLLDPVCNEAYPDLKARFIALLDGLQQEPLVLENEIIVTAEDVIAVMQAINGMVQIAPYIPRMIAELEQGQADTYMGIVSGELPAPPGDMPTGTPETATPVADDAAVDGDLDPELAQFLAMIGSPGASGVRSPAQRFLGRVLAAASSLPEGQSNELLVRLFLLDKLPPTRSTLHQFIDRAFAEPELAGTREALEDNLSLLGDDDIRDVFRYLEDAFALIDPTPADSNTFVFNSVECNESVPFQRFERTVETAMALEIPELGANTLPGIAAQFVACEDWPSGRAPEIADLPVHSDIPTLILAGTYDLQTPLSWNKEAFVTLPNAGLLIFPMSGHGVITFSQCAADVTAEFIENPTVYPDASCIAGLYPEWALPDGA